MKGKATAGSPLSGVEPYRERECEVAVHVSTTDKKVLETF